ncbi:MAG: fibronectin type III domain-containing protein [Candidatus Jettenia caeni]|nr:MAG: fibronectin type III domain-containing protein [Candidatus Jettenia caeni]
MHSTRPLHKLFMFLFGFSILMFSSQAYAAVSQVHLSWQHDPASSMTVMWSSDTSHSPPMVEYGETTLYGSMTAGVDTVHGEPIHTVELTGLTPDTLYHYRVSDDGGLWSQDYTFRTAPAPGTSGTGGLVFTVVGDKNTEPNSILINAALSAQNAGLHLIAGDLAYTSSDSSYHTWIEQQSVYATSAALMPAWGNHDTTGNDPPYSFAQAHFSMPTNGTLTERYYSYNAGNAHFLTIDSNTDSSTNPDSVQYAFIDSDLAAAASDPNIQWIIVCFHRNVYSGGGSHSDSTSLRANLQPLFDKYNVDLVFQGHNHNYARTKPLAYNALIKDNSNNFGPEAYNFSTAGHGQIYLVVGGGGAGLHPCSTTLPDWVIRCDSEYSFAHVIIDNDILTFQALRSDGTVLDDGFTITKSPSANRPPVVSAGPDQTITLSGSASLDGTVTDDGLPDPPGAVTTTWSKVSGPGTVTFTDNNAVVTTASFSDAGTYVLRLDANDGELAASDDVEVVVSSVSVIKDFRVSIGSDDAEEKAKGNMALNGDDLELVFDGGNQTVGMRFSGVDIPQNAIIVNAYIQFKADEATSSGTPSLTIQGEKVDNATAFTSLKKNISSRPRTTSAVSWSPVPWAIVGQAGPDQRTPNIAAVIQEIVNRSGWLSGNSLVLIITGTGKRIAESFEGDQAGAPLLHVEYN